MLKKSTTLGMTFCALLGMTVLLSPAQAEDSKEKHGHAHDDSHAPMFTEGVVVLRSTKGNKVRGRLTLKQTKSGVRVTGRVTGLTPGEHGFHIHEFGDLRAADGTAAGGHYNPDGHDHGAPDDHERHAGDLGNITADSEGVSKVDITQKDLKLHFVIGRSIVVHAGKDDLKSQPSGDAGPRVAVGVIGIAQPPKKKN
ncbi:superoxide dismutase family protein [Thalassoglobus sp.]|uniref:superoxide dismutase family protein n=1 Tax=Thalassoglobus sp. TaxID=2795869 RepID=UPI003AA87154